jgi:hypothetical protein
MDSAIRLQIGLVPGPEPPRVVDYPRAAIDADADLPILIEAREEFKRLK